MRSTHLRRLLWALVGIASLAFAWLVFWTGDPVGPAEPSETAFLADFELTDHNGMVRTQGDFAGKWMLIFFGFANCPDVCPTTLAELSAVMKALGEDAAQVQPLFISIDPERDKPSALAEFVPLFDRNIIGLTGTPDQIELTAKSFYIFYEKIEEAAAPGGYTMGHSSQLFLFGPDADYVQSWQYGTPAEEIVSDLRERFSS